MNGHALNSTLVELIYIDKRGHIRQVPLCAWVTAWTGSAVFMRSWLIFSSFVKGAVAINIWSRKHSCDNMNGMYGGVLSCVSERCALLIMSVSNLYLRRPLLAHRGTINNMVLRTLQWRHNVCDGVSKHQPHDCLLNRLFWRRSKKTSKLRVNGLCEGNSPVKDLDMPPGVCCPVGSRYNATSHDNA